MLEAACSKLDDEGLHQQRNAAVALGPRHSRILDATALVLQPRHLRHDARLELAGVEVAPLALDPAVHVRSVLARLGIAPDQTTGALHMHRDAAVLEFQIHTAHRLWLGQSQQLFVELGVLHVDALGCCSAPNSIRHLRLGSLMPASIQSH